MSSGEPDQDAPHQTSPKALEVHIDGTTLAVGIGPAWKHVFVQSFVRRRAQPPFLVPAVAEPLIVWIITGEARIEEREIGGPWSSSDVSGGDFFLTHSATPYEMRWQVHGDEPLHVMHLYMSVALLERVSHARSGSDDLPVLREISGSRDETLSDIMKLLLAAAQRPLSADPLFVDGLAQSLAAHVLGRYAVAGEVGRSIPALPGHLLRRAFDFMHAQLAETFDLAGTAQAAGLSQFHFSRLFKQATGSSPSQYFIRKRVEEAQRLLRETDLGVTEIGMAVGYSSPSHFSQVFRRTVGLSPRRYREA